MVCVTVFNELSKTEVSFYYFGPRNMAFTSEFLLGKKKKSGRGEKMFIIVSLLNGEKRTWSKFSWPNSTLMSPVAETNKEMIIISHTQPCKLCSATRRPCLLAELIGCLFMACGARDVAPPVSLDLHSATVAFCFRGHFCCFCYASSVSAVVSTFPLTPATTLPCRCLVCQAEVVRWSWRVGLNVAREARKVSGARQREEGFFLFSISGRLLFYISSYFILGPAGGGSSFCYSPEVHCGCGKLSVKSVVVTTSLVPCVGEFSGQTSIL